MGGHDRASEVLRDLMFGNPKLDELGWHEEALGRNAVVGGFQGQRQWTDWLPNGDFTEAIMASTFDWNGARQPTAFATENDTLNGLSMLLGTLVTNLRPASTTCAPTGALRQSSVLPAGSPTAR